jgi:hypothetical protein
MQIISLHVGARADERQRARPDLLERRLQRFHPRFRARVAAVAARHSRLADLAASFPALLFALAVPRAGFDREHVCARVIAGAPLRELAALTQLPLWLRRVPTEGFDRPIPRLPGSAAASGQIANHIPRAPKDIGPWLTAVGNAWGTADEAVAVWMARIWRRAPRRRRRYHEQLRAMCLWAWHSRHVPDDPCRLRTSWVATMRFDAAKSLTNDWLTNVELYVKVGDKPIADMWLKAGRVGPFEIVPLQTFADVHDEAMVMKHCVRTYGTELTENYCRLWSIRCNGDRVATFEIAQPGESPFLHVAQLKMADDARAPEGVWTIAHMWLRGQEAAHPGVSARPENVPVACAEAWRRMWRRYWLAKRCFPQWLPLTPTYAAIDGL